MKADVFVRKMGRGVPSRSKKFDNFIFRPKWCNLAHFESLNICVLGHEVCWGVLMNLEFRGSLGCVCVWGGGGCTHPVVPVAYTPWLRAWGVIGWVNEA